MKNLLKIIQSKFLISILASVIVFTALYVDSSFAQTPPRFYWKTLNNANAIPLIVQSLESNTNPLDPSNKVFAGSKIEATLMTAGYAKIFEVFGRSALVAVTLPVGRVSGTVTVAGRTFSKTAVGFGDPMVELGINIIGPDPIRNIPDMMRYEPGFSVDIIGDLVFPIGEYDEKEPLNIGQNRWYGRVGAPIIWQLSQWVPGQRTTLEVIPSVWFFGDNDDFVGQTLSTDPTFVIQANLTRDFAKDIWGSADLTYVTGGDSSLGGVESESPDLLAVGFTLGYTINEHMQLTVGYLSTINDNDDGDANTDRFLLSLTFGWHNLIEGMNRLSGN